MLKRLISRLKPGKAANKSTTQKEVVGRDHHCISRSDINENALKVLYRLRKEGYQAFLVGGGVRDLLLRSAPKDFDVATDAHPEEVHKLFRNSRLIGRRFRLVHVLFGRDVIEVATFRASHNEDHHKQEASKNDAGMLVRDNVYGDVNEDAMRRDLTINALYYNIEDFSVHSYAGGIQDLEQRLIRMIGDPATRYREDPVRMLRVARFAAKLDFEVHQDTAEPIPENAELLQDIPAARLFDESLKLFLSGQAVTTFHILREYNLFAQLFPMTDECLDDSEFNQRLVIKALENTDKRIQQGKPVTPAYLYAALLWPALVKQRKHFESQGMPPMPALHEAAHVVTKNQVTRTSLPKRFSIPMKEIWEMQLRLPRNHGKRAEQLVTHPRFRASYDFILLRESAGENLKGLGEWWTTYQNTNEVARQHLAQPHKKEVYKKRRPRRKPSQSSGQSKPSQPKPSQPKS